MNSYIRVTLRAGALGVESKTYEWIGDSPYAYIDRRDISIDNEHAGVFTVGPFRLILIQYEYHRDAWLCVRSDRLGVLRVYLYRSTRLLDLFYRRSIMTMAVWGLADHHFSRVPSYKDIHVVQRISEIIKNANH